ncbi:uncharacterized protein ColSpa_01172 [Colletotrichum spaethianum]|uniref:Uncharacterized protein n=1 Tax=Colletotrichum spaethianum TaxID=700344 RepID=A0AA37L2W6_9PEZI|nr:uncharacterized protein ColSpa_01172 [Colletotrichum spaethianum]GKT40991.1 hypothetical protein ColSpa_01172 [Colletotrichum spaethianum]
MSKLFVWNRLAQVLPETIDVEATSPDGITAIMKQLLSQTSMEDVDKLLLESASVRAVFRKNKLQVLRNLIAPVAREDAIACIDRRLHMGKAARKAFDRDYENGAVSQFPLVKHSESYCSGDDKPTHIATGTPNENRHPKSTDRGQWNLDDLCELVRVIDKLLDRKCSKTYPTFEEWEASWKSACPRRDVHAYRSVPSRDCADWTNHDPAGEEHYYQELCKDHGTEDPTNFDYAFQCHTKFEQTGVRHEGVQMDKKARARLQRAFFRLELIRRAYYQRPFFPKGARFAGRTRTVREGEFGTAGETYEKDTRLFPELSVRAAAIACVCNVYECQTHPAMGSRVRVDRKDGSWCWRWDDRSIAPWSRSASAPRSVKINDVFRMNSKSWAAVWRSDREYEKQLWTGPMAERERWEGYGHAGCMDPNECYCQLGGNCSLCLPLPDTELSEWDLFTKDELQDEIEEIEDLRDPELANRHPELAESIDEYQRTYKAVLY